MPTATTRQVTKPKEKNPAPKRQVTLTFEEGEMVIFRHRPDPEETRIALDAALQRMRRSRKKGDVVKTLREFRDNRRG